MDCTNCPDCNCPECTRNIQLGPAIPVALVCNLIPDTDDPTDPLCNTCAGTMCYKTEGGDQEVETIPNSDWDQTVTNRTAEYQQLLTGGATVTFTMDHLTPPGGGVLAGVGFVAITPAPIDTFRLTWDEALVGQFTVLLENVDIGPTFNIVPAPDAVNPAFGPGGTHQLVWNDITGINQIDFDIDATVPGADVINLSIDESVPLTSIAFVEGDTIEVLLVCNVCEDPPTTRYVDMSTGDEITDQDIIDRLYNCDIDYVEEEVCVTIDGETFTCIKRTLYASPPVDVFLGPNGVIVEPDSWVPGICDFETVTGYVFDCLRFDNILPINSDATFTDVPVGTNEIIFAAADVALLVREEIIKAQRVQSQEELHGEPVTTVVIVTDSGELYEFNPDALQSGTGSTLVIDEAGIIAWGINQTDLVAELQYSVFDNCDCKAVEVLQWIKDSNEVYLLDVFDITYDQSTGQKISLLDENRLLDFLTLGPFAGPCPEALQVIEVNPLCCNDDLVEGSNEIAQQRLAWLDASDETLMRSGGAPITGTTGEDVDEVWDKLQPGVAPSFVVPANVAPGDDDPPTAPTFVEDGLNGLSVLNFDSGDNDRLRLDTDNPSNGPFTLFYLVSATDPVLVSQACILAVGPDNSDGDEFNLEDGAWQLSRDGTQPSFIFRTTGPSIPAGGPGTDPLMLVQTGPYSAETSPSDGPVVGQNNTYQLERAIATEAEFFNGQFHLITVSYDDVNQILSAYFDGELRLQMDMSVMVPQFQMASDYFRIFGNRTGAAYLSGQLAEMFFADSFLSPEETAEVNSYLICKWGIDPSIVAGGLGDLELDAPGSYNVPTPFVQIVRADGTTIYRNTLNGQEFTLPPTPGLALCEDPTIESVELQKFDWMKQLCDRIDTITGLDLFFFNDANQEVQRVNAFTGDVEDSHSPDPAIDWAHGTVFDASGGPNGYYYLYDGIAAEWHRYDAGDIAAGSVNLGSFGGDPIVGSFTFGAFDPTNGLAYVGFVDQTRYEVDFNTSTITALPVFNGHTGAPSSLSITETGLHYMTAILAGAHTILHTVDVATGTCTPTGFFSDIPLNGADYDQDTLTGFYGIGIGNLYHWTELDGSDLEVIAPAVFSGTLAVGNTVISTERIEFQRVYHKDLVSGEVTSQDHDLEGADYEVQGIVEHCPIEVDSELRTHSWSELLCDIQTIVNEVTLVVTDTVIGSYSVNRVNGLTGAILETHAIGGSVQWTAGSFYDHNAGLYYVYDANNGHWHRYDVFNLAAGSTNLGAFGGAPIVGGLTFGTFDPSNGRGYVGRQDDTLYEIDPTLLTVTALPSITGLLDLLEAPSSLYLDNVGRFIFLSIGTGALAGTNRIYELDVATGVATYIADLPPGININGGGYDLTNNSGFYGVSSGAQTLYRWTNLDASNITTVGTPGTAPTSGTMDVVSSNTSKEVLSTFERVYHKDLTSSEVTYQDHDLEGDDYEVQDIVEHCPIEVESELCSVPAGEKVCYFSDQQVVDMSTGLWQIFLDDFAHHTTQATPEPDLIMEVRSTGVSFGQSGSRLTMSGSGSVTINFLTRNICSDEPFSLDIWDIDPGESITFNPAPDTIGPTGDGVLTKFTWNDGSLLSILTATIVDVDGMGLEFNDPATLGCTISEAFVSFDCDGIPTYRDTFTNDIVVDPDITPCHVGYVVLTLCDTDENGCQTTFLRHFNKDALGNHHYIADTYPDGVAEYTVLGTVTHCSDVPCRDTAISQLVTLDSGETWTPASLPANHVVTGMSVNVLVEAADSSITDALGTISTLIPAGLSMSWNTSQDYNNLTPPDSIFAGTGGRVMINLTLRDETP